MFKTWLIASVLALLFTTGASAQLTDNETWKEIERILREHSRKEQEGDWTDRERLNHQALLLQYSDYFLRSFPGDKRVHRVRAIWLEIAPKVAEGLGVSFDEARWAAELAELERAKDVPRSFRDDVAFGLLNARARLLARGKLDQHHMEEFLASAEQVMQTHKRDLRSAQTAIMIGKLTERTDEQRADRAYAFAAASSHPEIAADATFARAVLPYYHRPLDLDFTAIDGRKVSLAALRGKVVVLDFWATWCGPCVRELPKLRQLYDDYQIRGLEVIGISLDNNRSKLTGFVQEHGVKWPQYFDGLGWDTKLSRRFGISSIPAVFIVGRDGRLVTAEGRENLKAVVTQLLAK